MDSKRLNRIKYIFFDFDGVLAESVNVKTEAFRKMYLKYGEDFAERVVEHHKSNGGVSRFEKFKIYNEDWLGQNLTEEKTKELVEEFSSLVVGGVVNSKEVEGTTAFLNNSEEYIKYIITGTPTVEINPILEERNMKHFFKSVHGSPEKKSFWVKKILEEGNIASNECVFIGDAEADYIAAKDTNMTFILRETIEGEEVFQDYKGLRIKDITELKSLLESI